MIIDALISEQHFNVADYKDWGNFNYILSSCFISNSTVYLLSYYSCQINAVEYKNQYFPLKYTGAAV